jgi:hypothetical protein
MFRPLKFKVSQVLRAIVFAAVLSLFGAASVSAAYGQFTLTPPAALQPSAVTGGESAVGQIMLGGSSGPVTLSCAVTVNQVVTTAMTCYVSPSTATPDATLSLTVTAASSTGVPSPAGQYAITVTGTDGVTPQTTAPLFLNVVNVQEFYTISVSQAINPSTVSPGGTATAIITITPIGSYSGNVALSCQSVTPTVTAAPICSFLSTADPTSSVVAVNGAAATATLSIATFGSQQNQARVVFPKRIFYALWLGLPGLALAGIGAAGKHRRQLFGLLLLMALAAGVMVLPSCGGTRTIQNNNSGLTTPKNSYTVTLTGVDQNGNSPSNSTTDLATVSLTVN